MVEIKFRLEPWEETESKGFDLLVSEEKKKRVFNQLGYRILGSGELFDIQKKKIVLGKDNLPINLKQSPNLALISGSHHFVRDLVEYSELLVEKQDIKFKKCSEDEEKI